MNRHSYTFTDDITGSLYQRFLDAAAEYCAIALLVVRDTMLLDDEARWILKKLENYLIVFGKEVEWPGTKLLEGAANVFKYRYVPGCVEVLKESSDSLFQWLQPQDPKTFVYCERMKAHG